ncbi:MAG: hypothetical protein AAGC92_11080 [Pseudomonadota bacterium]
MARVTDEIPAEARNETATRPCSLAKPFEILIWLPFLAGMVEFVLSGQMPFLLMAVTALVALLGECANRRIGSWIGCWIGGWIGRRFRDHRGVAPARAVQTLAT